MSKKDKNSKDISHNKTELEKLQEFKENYFKLKELLKKRDKLIREVNLYIEDIYRFDEKVREKLSEIEDRFNNLKSFFYYVSYHNKINLQLIDLNLREKDGLIELRDIILDSLEIKDLDYFNEIKDLLNKFFDIFFEIFDINNKIFEIFENIKFNNLSLKEFNIIVSYKDKEGVKEFTKYISLKDVVSESNTQIYNHFFINFEEDLESKERILEEREFKKTQIKFNKILAVGVIGALLFYIFQIIHQILNLDSMRLYLAAFIILCLVIGFHYVLLEFLLNESFSLEDYFKTNKYLLILFTSITLIVAIFALTDDYKIYSETRILQDIANQMDNNSNKMVEAINNISSSSPPLILLCEDENFTNCRRIE